jgi:hypothetical protein
MKGVMVSLAAVALIMLWSPSGGATMLFVANLNGGQEVPPNASTGAGLGDVLLNNAQTQITVDLTFSGLLSPASAAHIHGPAPAGVNAPVLFPLSGLPASTSGIVPTPTFAITATQVGQLESGSFYMDVHDAVFPGGEIRGQLSEVPEPTTVSLISLGLGSLLVLRRMHP